VDLEYGPMAQRELCEHFSLAWFLQVLTSESRPFTAKASNMTDVIEAFIYDSAMEVDAVCRAIEAKSYSSTSLAKDGLETERRVFLAGRGELLKIAILQVGGL
jgi:hypothetical protein